MRDGAGRMPLVSTWPKQGSKAYELPAAQEALAATALVPTGYGLVCQRAGPTWHLSLSFAEVQLLAVPRGPLHHGGLYMPWF